MSENLFLALVVRDQHCRWPGCTVRATWCDAHHVTEWGHDGRTNESTCALLCHHHHSLTHQPGWSITGNGHEFTIDRPDGTVEISQPPAVQSAPPGRSTLRRSGSEPPLDVDATRAALCGREPATNSAHDSEQLVFS